MSNLGVTEPGADAPAGTPPPGPARFVFPELGAAAQAAVPGFYAWGVTIMPAAWSRGAPVLAKLSAIAGVIALVGFVLAEPRLGWRARIGGVWSLLAAGVVTWAAAPSALSAFHLDAVHGIAGMFGWGLFAYASAGPAIRRTPSAEAALAVAGAAGVPGGVGAAAAAPPRGRLRLRRGDHVYIGAALLVATLLQTVGWSVVVPERALFVRLVTLMAAIALLGASAELATARYARRKRPSPRARLRRALPLLVGLAVVGILGVILAFTIVPLAGPFLTERVVPSSSPMALVDIVAVVVLLGAAVAFFFGSTALARAEDLSAAYWLVVGTLAMRSAVHLVRTAPER